MVNVIKFKCILKNCKLIYKFPFNVWACSFQIGTLIKLLPIDAVSVYLECKLVFTHFLEISRVACYISEERHVVHDCSSVKLPFPGNLDSDQLLCFRKASGPHSVHALLAFLDCLSVAFCLLCPLHPFPGLSPTSAVARAIAF